MVEVDNAEIELNKAAAEISAMPGTSSSAGSIPAITKTVNNAVAFVKEGKKLITQRQKLIRMADRSDLGSVAELNPGPHGPGPGHQNNFN